ncbi:hypothetical protein EB155_04615 [archaeon]|nr:hypothetical protein [archaeon]
MKGTLISSDFIKDSSGNYRFIEMNTDAGFTSHFIDNYLDLEPFITFISSSSPQITTVEVVYKPLVCENFVEHLSQSLHDSASFVTSFLTHEEDLDTIYPTSPTDSDEKFILRLAYDENAILDSTYAKNTIEPLKLFYDNSSTSSIEFYYSSSYGDDNIEINTLNKVTNSNLLPDLVEKTNGHSDSSVHFLKLNSGSTDEEKINLFLSESGDHVISNFYINSDIQSSGVVQSIKSYSIVYGTTLSSLHLGMGNSQAKFALPTSSLSTRDVTNYQYADVLQDKHYYQFSTSNVKERNYSHGLFETETLVSMSGELLNINTIQTGSVMKSYHISDLPDSDDENVYRGWNISGYEFTSGSHPTSSVVTSVTTSSFERDHLIEIKLNGDDEYRYVTPSINILVYDSGSNLTSFIPSEKVNSSNHYFINESGSLISIDESNEIIINNPTGSVYSVDVESSDLIFSDGNTLGASFVFHNFFFPGPGPMTCFAAGTQVSLSNGDTKNIEDIVVGDEVLGWNGESLEPAFVTAIDHRHTVSSHAEACKSLGDEPSLYTINDTGLEFTPEHPFLTKEGWKSLVPNPNDEPYKTEQEPMVLQVGDSILRNGEWEEIDTIGIVRSIPEERVYNITVEGLHSYVVNGVVVHNKQPAEP